MSHHGPFLLNINRMQTYLDLGAGTEGTHPVHTQRTPDADAAGRPGAA